MNMSLSKLWEMAKDREDWRAAAHGVTKSQNMTEWLNNNSSYYSNYNVAIVSLNRYNACEDIMHSKCSTC